MELIWTQGLQIEEQVSQIDEKIQIRSQLEGGTFNLSNHLKNLMFEFKAGLTYRSVKVTQSDEHFCHFSALDWLQQPNLTFYINQTRLNHLK